MSYQIYIVIRDMDYPMPPADGVNGPSPQPWEAGWYAWVGDAGDLPPAVIDDYQDAIAKAEELTLV